MNEMDSAIEELIKSFNYMLTLSMKETTKCYDGIVLSSNNNGKWNVKYNGEIHALKGYGTAIPNVNTIVKVIVPQGNQALAWFFVPIESSFGEKSATFIPSVSETGMISWSNDGGLPNPTPVNIKGPQGEQGLQGEQGPQGNIGPQGNVGPYFTPSVDKDGNLSWTNNGDLSNPSTVNIKGPQGIQGIQGEQGPIGEQGIQGQKGDTGPYFTPSVSSSGDLSWTNNGNLNNPNTVNIRGPQGIQGEQGIQGNQGDRGEVGPYFIPSVSTEGILSWTNTGGLDNPDSINIQGPQGEPGPKGEAGSQGERGPIGATGPYFTPSVSSSGDLSWTNNGNLNNPNTVNIRGPQGIQGEQGIQGNQGDRGEVGPYFIPSVSTEGILSWTNTGGLDNPDSINIQGPQGEPGPKGEAGSQGERGPIGATGPYFTPSVDSSGNLSWSNNGGLENPQTVNISGPQGIEGPQGPTGANGKSAYQYAQDGGFSGSESDFASDLSNIQNGPFLPITGGTLTGNLTGQYITGTWLQGTASNQLQTTPQRICVQDTSGWIYSRTPSQILGDIGGAPKYTYSTTDLVAGSSSLSTGVMYLVYE